MPSGRDKMVGRFGPEVAKVLEPQEESVAAGYAQVPPGWARFFFLGPIAAVFGMRHYWVVVTNRRLLLFRMKRMGTRPQLDVAVPKDAARVVDHRSRRIDVRVTVSVRDGEQYRLEFPLTWKRDGEAVSAALAA